MARLVFFQGPMGCGKSTLALQRHHTSTQCGRTVLLLTRHERDGETITSRIGLSQPATVLQLDTDVYELVRQRLLEWRPATLGQAARMPGITPAAISLLMVHLKRHEAADPSLRSAHGSAAAPAG